MKILAKDYLTHIDNKEDFRYLRSPLFDVNMRLFNNNFHYRRMVQACCDILQKLALAEYEDYKKPHGMSGANAGIPFNIIAIVENRGSKNELVKCMINPKIIEYLGDKIQAESNCGSIRLSKSIKVWRWNTIFVEYYDVNDGKLCGEKFNRNTNSFTVQHEIDHNNGILITDRQI